MRHVDEILRTKVKPPKLVGRQTAALAAKDEHAARQPARRVTVKGSRARFALQHGPRGAVDVPTPAVVPLLQIRHPAVDVHRVAVQDRRVFVPRGRSALARREQVPGFRLCKRRSRNEGSERVRARQIIHRSRRKVQSARTKVEGPQFGRTSA